MDSENFVVDFVKDFLPIEKANAAYEELLNSPFITPTFQIRGRPCTPNRKMIGYGDAGVSYPFSGATFNALPWTPLLEEMKEAVENATNARYNYVLVNYYPDGTSKIAVHKDDEVELDPVIPIPCISLGAVRSIRFRRRGYSSKTFELANGSLYVMHPPTNKFWTHEIPAEPNVKEGRISLTFRSIQLPTYLISSSNDVENSQEEPASKKTKQEFSVDDWLDQQQLMMELQHAYIYNIFTPKFFRISETLICRVLEYNGLLRIDMRRFRIENSRRIPTKEGIVFGPVTWFYFCQKIHGFNFIYKDALFISNNEILAFKHGNGLHLQQMCLEKEVPFLKNTFIQLFPYEFEKLLELENEITNCLIVGLWEYSLPQKIFSKALDLPTPSCSDDDELRLLYFNTLEKHMRAQILPMFRCEGCIANSFSQLNHDCIYKTTKEIFHSFGPHVWLLLNIPELLCEMNINFSFVVENLTFSDYKKNIFL